MTSTRTGKGGAPANKPAVASKTSSSMKIDAKRMKAKTVKSSSSALVKVTNPIPSSSLQVIPDSNVITSAAVANDKNQKVKSSKGSKRLILSSPKSVSISRSDDMLTNQVVEPQLTPKNMALIDNSRKVPADKKGKKSVKLLLGGIDSVGRTSSEGQVTSPVSHAVEVSNPIVSADEKLSDEEEDPDYQTEESLEAESEEGNVSADSDEAVPKSPSVEGKDIQGIQSESQNMEEDNSVEEPESAQLVSKEATANSSGVPVSEMGKEYSETANLGNQGTSKKRKGSAGGVLTVKKSGRRPTGITVDGTWFQSNDAAGNWPAVLQRPIIHEKIWDDSKYKAMKIKQLLIDSGLMPSLQKSKVFSEQLIREIMVNLPTGFGDKNSPDYGVVFVRGRQAKLSPDLINEYFDVINPVTEDRFDTDYNMLAKALTGGKRSVWGDNIIPSNLLTVKYALLFFIGVYNWIPGKSRVSVTKSMGSFLYQVGTGKKVDLGMIIHNQIANHGGHVSGAQCIVFPSLITELVTQQLSDILVPGEIMSGNPKIFTSDHKLFAPTRFNDIDEVIQFRKKTVISGIKQGKQAKSVDNSRDRLLSAIDDELEHLTQTIRQHVARKKELTDLAREIRYPSIVEEESDDEEDDSSSK